MSAKRLLLVATFYPPLAGGGVHRVLSFTRDLPALGWACTVICAGEEDYWVRDPSLLAQVPPETEVIRVRGGSAIAAWLRLRRGDDGRRSGKTFGGLRRLSDWLMLPDSYAGWGRRAAAAAAARLGRGDVRVVLSSSPPDSAHVAADAALARTARRVPWIADFRDPWVGLGFRTPPTAWHRARQRALERGVLERADLVLAASRTHADALEHAEQPPRRVVHLPNGFAPVPRADDPPAADTSAFRLAFTGTLSLMPDVGTLLEAVHEVLARRPEARRRLRVDLAGPYDTGYEDRATALGLTGIVRFLGARPHAETRALQRAADVLVLWKPRGEGYRTMVPGKLYEYLDSGRPIVALLPPDDETAALVRRAGGSVLAPGDRTALALELETRYMNWKTSGRAPGARPHWLDEHARPHLSARLAAELDRLLGGER